MNKKDKKKQYAHPVVDFVDLLELMDSPGEIGKSDVILIFPHDGDFIGEMGRILLNYRDMLKKEVVGQAKKAKENDESKENAYRKSVDAQMLDALEDAKRFLKSNLSTLESLAEKINEFDNILIARMQDEDDD